MKRYGKRKKRLSEQHRGRMVIALRKSRSTLGLLRENGVRMGHKWGL